ncbi:MAG: hypothetical protein AB8I08_31310 [Sandaracinaceae bacterium]
MRSLSLLLLTLGLLAGCASDTRPRGFTDCGDFPDGPVECQPGQYCVDPTFSECQPGCTSDVNCADGQTCEKVGTNPVGNCVNASAPMSDAGPGPGPGPDLTIDECVDACDNAGFFCEDRAVTATEVAACSAWCRDPGTSTVQRQALIDCTDAAFSSAALCDEASCLP